MTRDDIAFALATMPLEKLAEFNKTADKSLWIETNVTGVSVATETGLALADIAEDLLTEEFQQRRIAVCEQQIAQFEANAEEIRAMPDTGYVQGWHYGLFVNWSHSNDGLTNTPNVGGLKFADVYPAPHRSTPLRNGKGEVAQYFTMEEAKKICLAENAKAVAALRAALKSITAE